MPILHKSPASQSLSSLGRIKIGCVLIISVLLGGCASTNEKSNVASYGLFGPMSGNASWQDTVDPISEYLARQQSAGIKVNPDDVDHPLAKQMLTQLGIRYRFGGKSPSTGFDCSGLVFYSAQESLGLKLPPRSDEMAKLGSNIERNDLKAGDLVFFNTMGRRYSHVGVYLGDSKFVHSPAAGGVVRVEDMTQRYWDKRFTGARRLDGSELASVNPDNDTTPLSISGSSLSKAQQVTTGNASSVSSKANTKTIVRTVSSKNQTVVNKPSTVKSDATKSIGNKSNNTNKVTNTERVASTDKTTSAKPSTSKSAAVKPKGKTAESQ